MSRNGLRTIRNFAQNVCKFITFWTPAIKIAFPGNPVLYNALVAANLACSTLVEQADNVLPHE